MISIDALRPDRMSLYGYERPTTPMLSKIAAGGAFTSDSISTSAFTQPALPSMLTSSRPLSYGGYDNGAIGRPDTLFKVLGKLGYKTSLLSTFPWVNQFYGYVSGIHNENLLFVINALVGVASQTMASIIRGYLAGEIDQTDTIEAVRPTLNKLYDDLEVYCDHRLERYASDIKNFSHERLIMDGYNYNRIKKIVARHKRDFNNNPATYLNDYLNDIPNAHNWIAHDWRMARSPAALASLLAQRVTMKLLGPIFPERARLGQFKSKRYIDARTLADQVIRIINSHETDHPFLIYTHLLDTHVPYLPGSNPHWRQNAKHHLSALGYSSSLELGIATKRRPETTDEWKTWGALYDAAVHYVDSQIGRIRDALKETGQDSNTILVVVSDHGEELGEHGDVSHHFRLYEHNIRVPLIFSGPDVPKRCINGLTTIMDLAPTLLDIVSGDPVEGWEGASIFSNEIGKRNYVNAEAFHSGNCLFDHRPPYIAVRTDRYKYLWKEYRDVTDNISSVEPELYEHRSDPLEKNDLYYADHPALPTLNKIVAERLAEISEISDARIIQSFNEIGVAAIREVREREINSIKRGSN